MSRIFLQLLRRVWLPTIIFVAFNLLSVLVYVHLEHLCWPDAFFWITHPPMPSTTEKSMTLQNSSQYSFILASSLSRFGSPNEFWSRFSIAKARRLGKPWCNDLNIEKTYDHFIICGYGQVGRTVIEQLARLHIPFVLIETNEGFILNS